MKRRHRTCAPAIGLLLAALGTDTRAQILEYRFNDTGVTSVSTGADTSAVTFKNLTGTTTDLHSTAGAGVAGDLIGHADYGTDRAFDNTDSIQMQSLGGIALNETSTAVSELDSWTVSGWYKTDGDQVLGSGGTVIFQSPTCYSCQPGVGNAGFAVRGEWGNGFRTTVNGANTGAGAANQWLDSGKWVFFAVAYDGLSDLINLNYYRGYRNADEAGESPVEAELTSFLTHDYGPTTYSPGISIGNRTDDMSRAFDGLLDNLRVFGSRSGSDGALSLTQVDAIRAHDMALTHVVGDYNSDGAVDEGDYGLWEESFGSTDYLYADGNGDGAVDAADYTVWRDAMGVAAAAVPEPAGVLLTAIAVAATAAGRSRNGNRRDDQTR